MLSAILEGLSIWLVVSTGLGYALGALIQYGKRQRLQNPGRVRV
jgi:hypothetical protein